MLSYLKMETYSYGGLNWIIYQC